MSFPLNAYQAFLYMHDIGFLGVFFAHFQLLWASVDHFK